MRKTSRRSGAARVALTLACALSLVLTGCAGDDTDDAAPDPSESVSASTARPLDLAAVLGAKAAAAPPLDDSAEGAESYVPTGEIVADSGFRPGIDGFSFPNYGNEVEPQNLMPGNVEHLFGSQVCVSGSGDTCVLTPAAEKWMEEGNEAMGGGHCMGFSVASLRLYAETLAAEDYGDDQTHDLELPDNDKLQGTLAESFAYQDLQSVKDRQFMSTPTKVVTKLIELLDAGRDTYTLGFYKRDGNGGHAVTPIAVEDKGNGQMAIIVYDNNYPDTIQAMEIDTKKDTYRYVGATNPNEEPDVYDGDATTVPLELIPTTPGEAMQPCPFCDDELVDAGAGKGTVLGAAKRYTELSLTGDNANHPHLLLTTEDGKRSGIVNGRLLEEIPGVQVVLQWADDPSIGGPEPKFRIPFGTSVNVTIDGSKLKKTSKDINLNFAGDGKVISAEDFSMEPGQVDELYLAGGKTINLVYTTNSKDGDAPTFFAGVDEKDASYTLGATAVGLKKGSQLGFVILQDSGQVLFDTSDATGENGEATVIAVVGKLDETAKEQVWIAENIRVNTRAREDVYLNYKDQPLTAGKPITLEVGPEDGPYRTVTAAFQ
jgi:hypothetical protein